MLYERNNWSQTSQDGINHHYGYVNHVIFPLCCLKSIYYINLSYILIVIGLKYFIYNWILQLSIFRK